MTRELETIDKSLEETVLSERGRSDKQGKKEAGGCHLLGTLRFLRPQLTGDVAPRTMTEEESHSLDNGHHRKHDTYGSRRLGIYFTHKIGICHVVEGRHQHADDGRHSQ